MREVLRTAILVLAAAGCGRRAATSVEVLEDPDRYVRFDVGEVIPHGDETIRHEFAWKNTADRRLSVVSKKDTCTCAGTRLLDSSVEAGGTLRMEMALSLTGRGGHLSALSTLVFDDGSDLRLSMGCRIRRPLAASPSSVRLASFAGTEPGLFSVSVFHPREDGLTAVAGAPWLHATIGETKALPTDTFRTDISLRADAIEGPDRRETTLLVQERGGERYSCNVRVAQETVSSVQLVPPALRLTDSASHVVRVARPASARGTSPARDVRVLSAPEGLHVELLRDASSGATSISVRRDRDLVAGEVEVSADDTVLYLPVVSAAGAPLR